MITALPSVPTSMQTSHAVLISNWQTSMPVFSLVPKNARLTP
jgi:hypothetical protein